MKPLIGQIELFAGNFSPEGWALCDGQQLNISENSALFSLLGTIYGGDGKTTFALPDLRSRMPIHAGNYAGEGLTSRRLGEKSGSESKIATHAIDDDLPIAMQNIADSEELTSENNMPPFLAMNYIIALQGSYPSKT